MRTMLKPIGAAAIVMGLISVSAPASAALSLGAAADFTNFGSGAGVHGLEARGGRSGTAGDWEIGLGTGTSQPGHFNQSQYGWGNAGTWHDFQYTYNSDGSASFTIGGVTTSWGSDLGLGNAIKVSAKRTASITITELDGAAGSWSLVGDTSDPWNINTVFVSSAFADGFTMAGQMALLPGGGSANEILIEAGNVPAVPLPAAVWFLLTALGGLAGSRWLKTGKAA
ncbi:VPLPA-CTERM sorting domain-containing protein [Roseospira navarrensis]|uniref:VPLPA-CTERM sorting domain-containing protein n=1 Tax=Roseospira navarrensis TaxID=140058 RepID=A0A7X1ZHS2_9PROT|nr:VPLPA-CTERM sorting domain-containing protein [Roseospira navarrensis]MQX37712.1 VPLPA-CTERM sorting domain-containing protein [Roseospira navarrensis]